MRRMIAGILLITGLGFSWCGCAHDDLDSLSLVSAKEISDQKKLEEAAKGGESASAEAAAPGEAAMGQV